MNKKALLEKRNAKKEELNGLLETASKEVRGLTSEEDTKFVEIETEIRELDATIEKIEINEKRAKDEAIKVEVLEINEKRGTDMENTVEREKRGLAQYIRNQDGEELRGMTTAGDGSKAIVPTHLYDEVIQILDEVAPLFARVPKLTPVNGTLEILKETDIELAGWVGEEEVITDKNFSMGKVKLEQRRCGSAVELSQYLINDAGVDIVEYSRNVLSRRLAKALDRAMVKGAKATSFEGLENAVGTVEVTEGATGAVAIEDFMGMLNAMNPELQAGAVWVFSRELFNEVSLLQDAIGKHYIMRDTNVVDNKPAYRLFGQEILINDAVAKEATAGTKIGYLVNFGRAYAGMIKKNVEFSNISGDTQNRLKGSATLVMDIFADCKVVDEKAIVTLKRK